MSWLDETHGTNFELVRHFLARMFDSEMFSARGQWRAVAAGAFALALPAGMMLLDPPYYHGTVGKSAKALRALALADDMAVLTMVLSITGVLALLAWQSLFPSRRDYTALAGLPVRPRQIFAARFMSMTLLAAAIAVALCLLPSIMSPHQFTDGSAVALPPLAKAAARAFSCLLGCLFVFYAIVALQGVLLNALPGRWFARASSYVQGLLIAAFVLAGLYGSAFRGAWGPPAWFAGLQQALLGDRDPSFRAMAARAVQAAACAVGLAALTYLAAYGRSRRLLLESGDEVAPRPARWSAVRLLARDPRRQAALEFMAAVLSRSRLHRLVLLAYAGAGLGIMINSALLAGMAHKWSGGWRPVAQFICLYWPLGMSFILLAGVRHAFSLPAELRANWLFQVTEAQGRREWMSAVERFVLGGVIAPVYLLTFAAGGLVLGWGLAFRMVVLQSLVSLTAFELLFHDWQQLPFTCSYAPGKRSMAALLASWMAVLAIVLPALSRIIAGLSLFTPVFLFYLVPIAAVWIWFRRRRRDGWGESILIYEDRAGELADLGIREMSYGCGAGFSLREPSASPERDGAEAPCGLKPAPPVPPIAAEISQVLTSTFPHEFQNVYGEDLSQATRDSLEPTWRRHGALGLARLLWDLAVRIPIEHLAEFGQDIRYSLRRLRASPGFTGVALISLSLGIGVATSAFSEMSGFILRDIPALAKPGELAIVRQPLSYPEYRRYRDGSDLFSSTMAYAAPVPLGVSLGGRSERFWGHLVTPSYFATLGVHPMLGRFFGPEYDKSGQPAPVVVSHRFWQVHLGYDWGVVGKMLRVNGQPCRIIGVGPRNFLGAWPMVYVADLWLPASGGARTAPELAGEALERRDRAIFHFEARLRPGVSAARAEAALDAVARPIEQENGEPDRGRGGRRVTVLPGGKMMPISKRDLPFFTTFFMLLGGTVLLIACSNAANMMFARAADRRREIAVRLSLGAGRIRLIRQLLTESMLLAAAAGVLGFLFTLWIMGMFSQMNLPWAMPLTFELHPDGRVLLFTILLTVITALTFGLAPALQATSTDLTPALKEGGNIKIGKYRRLNTRNVLVLSEVAGSLMLLLITAYMVLGHRGITNAPMGFDPKNLYVMSLDPLRDGYSGEQESAFFPRLLDRVKRLPAVRSAVLADSSPMAMIGRPGVMFSVAGSGQEKELYWGQKYVVGSGYFENLGIPILRGRSLRPQDETDGSRVAIVSENLAHLLWNGADALGRQIEIGSEPIAGFEVGPKGPAKPSRGSIPSPRLVEVVGVAKNVRDGLETADSKIRAAIYLPLRPSDYSRPVLNGFTLLVRAAPGVDAIAAVRREISTMDAGLTVFNARAMPQQIEQMMFPVWMALKTYGFIGLAGLILASVGLAGVSAYSVARRGREIGIRIALGAQRADVLGLVMKEGAVLIGMGTVLGLALAWAAIRALSGIINEMARVGEAQSYLPFVMIGAPVALGALALAACYVPARKSTRI
ncbi:MAG: ABC transporter permease, partial [Acidobacteriia bacterium]|nr:ABC transporter permease [Terriglobia bacterium]